MPNHILTGSELNHLFQIAKKNNFAIPAVNVTNSNTIIACLETAKQNNCPIIIQFSHGGASSICGKSIDNTNHEASIQGAIAGAQMIHALAKVYNVQAVIHTDHCARKLLPWFEGVLSASEEYFTKHGRPLFTSQMLDLSTETLTDNIEISAHYLERMTKIDMLLEIELGITGGEEDGVDNHDVDNAKLYTQPADVALAYEKLSSISPNFSIAASFGNVHGVYKPGNVHLQPIILKNSQEFIKNKFNLEANEPINLVFHGGSGSTDSEIKEAVSYGVVKMNLDTDMQWALWHGVKNYYDINKDYLQSQLGNPTGIDAPNKKFYDPRAWLRSGETEFIKVLTRYNQLLNNNNSNNLI